MSYTSLSLQMKSQTIQYPTQDTYEQLQQKYPETLQCPCKKFSIQYGKFVHVESVFHQVCSSDLISQDWIDFTFAANSTVMWPMDLRTSLSAMWQLMAVLCQSSRRIFIDARNEFISLPLISSIILSKQLLEIKVQSEINSMRESSSNNIELPLRTVHMMSEINRFVPGLSLNYFFFSSFDSIPGDSRPQVRQAQYIKKGSTAVCNCHSFGSCPLPGNIYLYDMWETNSTFDLNTIVANETIPGIVIDCTPFHMIWASSLECFYNQTCFKTLVSTYSKDLINIKILNESLPSRFLSTSSNGKLIKELFLEEILSETFYKLYYEECSSTHCTYFYSQRFDWIYVLTTLIALIGGLNTALRVLTAYFVKSVFFVKNLRQRPVGHEIRQNDNASIKIRVKYFFTTVKISILELNFIDQKSRNPLRIYRARIATRFYVVALMITISIVILYTSFEVQTIRQKMEHPTQKQYEKLIEQYPNTIECPCTTISISYQEFVEIRPMYHQLCDSDFIQPSWYTQLILLESYFSIFPDDFLNTAPSYFQALGTFCNIVNSTVNDAIRRFHSSDYVNDKLLSPSLFKSQMNSLIYSFFNATRIEFLYSISIINAMIHTNQYVSGSMTNIRLRVQTISEVQQYGFDPEIVIASNIMRWQQDGTYCSCAVDADCCSTNIISASQQYPESFGFASGCYMAQTVLRSSLRCWYNTTCIDIIRESYRLFGTNNHTPSMIRVLDPKLPSRFSSNDNLKVIVDELMIEKWNFFSNYDLYYQKCQVAYCSFTFTERASVVYMITTIIGLFGGLSIAFRLISISLAKILIRNVNGIDMNHSRTNRTNQGRLDSHNIHTRVRQKFINYNLFDDESTSIELIQKQRWSTRIYLCLLIFSVLMIVSYTVLLKQTATKLILKPTQEQYEDLIKSKVDQLQCPCSHIAIPHREFLKINTNFHQVCSSDFVAQLWFDYLFQNSQSSYYRRSDLRTRGFTYFKLLSLLCTLSQTTVMNSTNRFLTESFIISQMINKYEFDTQINVTINLFKRQTFNESSRTFQLVRGMLNGNAFISSYFVNWYISGRIRPNFFTYPVYPIVLDNGCSCGTRSDCIESGGIYHSFSNILHFVIPGWHVGCSSIETLLRSTLECFYNQTCIDMLIYYSSIVEYELPYLYDIRAMNISISSRFLPNTSIQTIVDGLFIEDWIADASYPTLYERCSPTFCSYKYESRKNALYALSRVLGFYGGITVSLRFLIPYIVELGFKIRNRLCLNPVAPLA